MGKRYGLPNRKLVIIFLEVLVTINIQLSGSSTHILAFCDLWVAEDGLFYK